MDLLIDAQTLKDNLNKDNIVIIDASTVKDEDTGASQYQEAHIPGAVYADLQKVFSDQSTDLFMMVLPSDKFAEEIGKLGVSNDTHVVVYDRGDMVWSTRLWWNLRLEGHDKISVLDGGFAAWEAAGFDVATGTESNETATFNASRRPELLTTKEEVLASLDDESTLLINALDEAAFTGESAPFGRAGHIPGSVNLPVGAIKTEDGGAAQPEAYQGRAEEIGALDNSNNTIAYCGGGVGATFAAFQLARLGREDVSVYDGSMTEWAADPEAPLVTSEK